MDSERAMNERPRVLTIPAKWTDDCQGKKDYDGEFVSVSTRYWPRGGGFFIIRSDANGVEVDENPAPEIPPSARSEILLYHGDPGSGDSITLAERKFEGETLEEVKSQVEEWAAAQYIRVAMAVAREFGKSVESITVRGNG